MFAVTAGGKVCVVGALAVTIAGCIIARVGVLKGTDMSVEILLITGVKEVDLSVLGSFVAKVEHADAGAGAVAGSEMGTISVLEATGLLLIVI